MLSQGVRRLIRLEQSLHTVHFDEKSQESLPPYAEKETREAPRDFGGGWIG